jgi:uncharacterized protein (DUF362 family)
MLRVSLIKGLGRRENVRRSLELIADDITRSMSSRQPVIKPNFVSSTRQLASSHVDQVRGILDFLTTIHRGRVLIAESACNDTIEAYRNFGYARLADEYDVELLDLNKGPSEEVRIGDRDGGPIIVPVSSLLLDRKNYLISAARMKTHDTVVVTLSVKNLAVGSIVGSDKKAVHQGIRQTNLNIAELALRVRPDLAVIDGYEGMEGDGPTGGDPVLLDMAMASTDALAADRIACEIMGVDLRSVGYLQFCAERGLGEADLDRIEVVGARLRDCVRPFRLHHAVQEQYAWKLKN